MNQAEVKSRGHIWIQRIVAVILISSLLAGCQLPWRPVTDKTPPAVDQAIDSLAETETPEPRQDLPPSVVEVSPLPKTIIDLNQPISVYFNQPMDKNSVEAAIHFEPGLSGGFSWEGEKVVTFTPDQPLSAGTKLRLAVDTSAQAANQLTLQTPYEVVYSTSENLKVLQVFPADEAMNVDPQSTVFVAFNQPVVPLGGESDGLPAFSLKPEVPGEGQWLNTHTYLFSPQPTMDGGTAYSIQINDELVGLSGASLDQEQQRNYSFVSTNPDVRSITPDQEERLRLDGPITIAFNIAMDPESVEAHFDLLSPMGTSMPGRFEWDDTNRVVSFYPSNHLNRNAVYRIRLGAEAKSFGGIPLETDLETTRTTPPSFSVDPQNAPEFNNYYGQFGNYQISFTTPLDSEAFTDAIRITPEVSAQNLYLSDDNTRINFSGYFLPESQYTLVLENKLRDEWEGQLAEEMTFSFSTPPAEPLLNLANGPSSNNLVFIPAASSEVILQATNINNVTIDISPITIEDLMTLLNPENYDYRKMFLPETLETKVHNLNLTRNINEIVRLPLTYAEAPLTPGVYYLGITSSDIREDYGEKYQKYFLVVSENNLLMKHGPEQALVWATKLTDLSPLGAVPLNLYDCEGELLVSGKTNAEGLFESNINRSGTAYTNFFAVMGEPGSEGFGFTISTWGQTYSFYDRGIRVDTSPRLHEAYIYTDRPIYRPGDMIHFKAVVFKRENGLPAPSGFDSVDITLTGDAGMAGTPSSYFSKTLTLDEFNTVSASIPLPDDAPPGYYDLKVEKDGTLLGVYCFNVKAYRKPEVEIGLEIGPTSVLAGEVLEATLQADYYFGLPAADQTYSWALYRDDAFFNLPGYFVGPSGTDWLTPYFPTFSPLGKMVQIGQDQTDLQGNAGLSFSTADLALDEPIEGSPYQLNLEVTLEGESGYPVSIRDSVLVHPESFYIGVQPEITFGQVNSTFDFSLLTVDWEKTSVGEVPVEAIFETIRWEFEQTMNPERPYRYIPETTLVGSASPVTDEEGKARLSFIPEEPGTYQLTLQSGDAVTQVILWVAGEGSAIWPRQRHNQIQLVADAESYQLGQNARVFVPNPFEDGGRALVTVERGEVIDTQLVNLTGSGQTISLPIDESAIPNIYLSVFMLGKDPTGRPDYRQGVINLQVAPSSKSLDIDLVLNPAKTEPGETVSATLSVRDVDGNPVQGAFSVAVVDKAVLALVDPISEPILEAFYGEQPLSIQTSYSLKTYANQLALADLDLGLGGGGDEAGTLTIRVNFPDTAFWEADVVTGADGTARLSIPMPDSLTTWVVSVRGLSEGFLVGETEAEVLTQKELMVRPVTPRFLVNGDRVEMAAVVHNNTSEAQAVRVSLQAAGFSLENEGQRSQDLTVSAGSQARVAWWGVVESVDEVDLTFTAVSGGLVDAVKPEWGALPVLHYVIPMTFSTFGQIAEEGDRLELVSLSGAADVSAGSLSVELIPSLAAILINRINEQEVYRYHDNISVISRLLTDLNAYLALRELGIDSTALERDLIQQISKDIDTLIESQHVEGGWAWWNGSQNPDPFISAYVLLGLDLAAWAGLEVGSQVIDQAVSYLQSQLVLPGDAASGRELDGLSFQVYALRRQDLNLSETIDGLYARRSELSPWSLGLLALTVHERRPGDNRIGAVLTDLEARALRSATGVHWEGEPGTWILPDSPTFNTSVSLFALAQLDPASTSLPPALGYILAHQKSGGGWPSPFDSAWAIMAMIETMQGTGDVQADFEFQAVLNDRGIAEGSATSAIPSGSVSARIPVGQLYAEFPNALQIQRGFGTGTLYYRADLRTYHRAEHASAINRGIQIQRDYYPGGKICPSAGCIPIRALELNPADPTQTIKVALTVTVPHDMVHFLLEDYIPAGTEVLDPSLMISRWGEQATGSAYDPRFPLGDGWGVWWFDSPQINDDHLLWRAEYLPAGTYTLVYQLIPLQRGVYQVLPAHAWQYFFPEVMGTSAGDVFEIE
jgi:alpha-2-macroglobulin